MGEKKRTQGQFHLAGETEVKKGPAGAANTERGQGRSKFDRPTSPSFYQNGGQYAIHKKSGEKADQSHPSAAPLRLLALSGDGGREAGLRGGRRPGSGPRQGPGPQSGTAPEGDASLLHDRRGRRGPLH